MPPQYSYPSKRASVTEVERSSAHASMMPHNSYGECEESYILMHSEYSVSSWWGEGGMIGIGIIAVLASSRVLASGLVARALYFVRYTIREEVVHAIRTAGAEAFVNVSFATDDFSLQLPPLELG